MNWNPEPWFPARDATAPLDTAGVLWVAAIDRVPIEERVEWVKEMEERVAGINAARAADSHTGAGRAARCDRCGRSSDVASEGDICGMPRPSGLSCHGTFRQRTANPRGEA